MPWETKQNTLHVGTHLYKLDTVNCSPNSVELLKVLSKRSTPNLFLGWDRKIFKNKNDQLEHKIFLYASWESVTRELVVQNGNVKIK